MDTVPTLLKNAEHYTQPGFALRLATLSAQLAEGR